MKRSTLYSFLCFLSLITFFTGCEKDDEFPEGKNEFVINNDSTNFFKTGKTVWLYNPEYEVNTISTSDSSVVKFEMTIYEAVLDTGKIYTGSKVGISISGDNIKTYTSNNDVEVKITSIGKQNVNGGYIAGFYKGTFFYVENARSVNVNINGTFSTTKNH